MSKLTIEERVDKLLEAGVDNPRKWMPIHSYTEPGMDTMISAGSWAAEWEKLRKHHIEETTVLFGIIGELVKRVKE